jgi:hypothetical protein
MKIKCAYCKKTSDKDAGDVNRAKKIGAPIYCDRKCAGLARRKGITDEEKKRIKAEYDKNYRKRASTKERKAEQFKKDYAANPDKYKEQRKRRYPKHLEYLRNPEYKAYKKEYDQKHRAEKLYGDFAEAAIALHKLRSIVDNRQAKKEQNIFNKSIKRKRNATKNIKRKELESCSVGIYHPS